MQLRVELGTRGEDFFTITLNDNAFVRKWVEELRWCLANCEFEHNEAFSSFMTVEQAAQHLYAACNTINHYLKNFIEVRPNLLDQDQEYFNYLHQKFEQLAGNFGQPTRLFAVANQDLKTAIRNLNFYCHSIEKKKPHMRSWYLSFNKDQYRRWPLAPEDYQHFEFSIPAGTLFVHYVELGKEFVDLYEDQLPIDYQNARNLHYYSGEACMMFFDYDLFEDPGFEQWLKSNNLNPRDQNLGHGKIVLGKVDNPADTCAKIQKYQHIRNIIIEE